MLLKGYEKKKNKKTKEEIKKILLIWLRFIPTSDHRTYIINFKFFCFSTIVIFASDYLLIKLLLFEVRRLIMINLIM